MAPETLRVERRFCGPPGTANGGYLCGLLARGYSKRAVQVTLRAPTPLETELRLVEAPDDGVRLETLDGTLLAEAMPAPIFALEVPAPVRFEDAQRASPHYIGFQSHPYPGCFVCGPARAADQGAGLRLFPGAVAGREAPQLVAAPFQPAGELCDAHAELASEFVWASLDCPSWFGHAAFAAAPLPQILLGRMTAAITRLPRAEERCVVVGFGMGQEGRRIRCGSVLYGEDGLCLAAAEAVWIALKT